MSSNPPKRPAQAFKSQEEQLIISLKFHHGKSIKDLPLDVAVDVMVKVWESCQTSATRPSQPGLMADRPRKIKPPDTVFYL